MADFGSASRVVCVLLVIFSPFQQSLGKRTLKFVSMVYRHGDRTPGNVYGTDPNTEDTWPQGFMQLTQLGMRQQYELGQFLRDVYVHQDFLNASYNRHQIQVWSSDTDRTLMSAQANLAGLYPPAGQQVWNPDILWQPIPVHTKPIEEDALCIIGPCPRLEHLYQEFQKTDPEFLKMEADNKESHNRTFPDWATPEVYGKLVELQSYMLRAITSDRERSRLLGGPLLGAMVNSMKQAKEGTLPDGQLRMMMYSSHDSTVAALLAALGTFNFVNPPYCACVMVELYQEDTGDCTVEVWYRNDSSHEPYLLTVPGCPNPCSYQRFLNATKDAVVADREKECQLGVIDQLKTRHQEIPLIAGGVVLVTIIALLIGVCVRRSRQSSRPGWDLVSVDESWLSNIDDESDDALKLANDDGEDDSVLVLLKDN